MVYNSLMRQFNKRLVYRLSRLNRGVRYLPRVMGVGRLRSVGRHDFFGGVTIETANILR